LIVSQKIELLPLPAFCRETELKSNFKGTEALSAPWHKYSDKYWLLPGGHKALPLSLFLNKNDGFCRRGGVCPRPQIAIEYVIEFMNY
jgi:hypothetical protein